MNLQRCPTDPTAGGGHPARQALRAAEHEGGTRVEDGRRQQGGPVAVAGPGVGEQPRRESGQALGATQGEGGGAGEAT